MHAPIAEEIAQYGPISFARFMELALYEPQGGYYASGRASLGYKGDFYTSVNISPIFGEILAGQFQEMWELMGCPSDFTVIEQGANNGQFAADVLDALQDSPLRDVSFGIIEPFAALRSLQAEKLKGRNVKWYAMIEEVPDFRGVHFSNELFDALPVHVIRSTGVDWAELRVVYSEGQFAWKPSEPVGELAGILKELPQRPAGYTTEIRLSHRSLLQALSRRMSQGFLLTVDYGMNFETLLAPHRKQGTLSCYRKHRRDDNPFEHPGEKDITSHVDFSSLVRDAEQAGFRLEAFTDQYHFLIGAAAKMLQAMDGLPLNSLLRKKIRGLQTLMHPESMGRQFYALLLSRGLNAQLALSGFQYAKDPQDQLFPSSPVANKSHC